MNSHPFNEQFNILFLDSFFLTFPWSIAFPFFSLPPFPRAIILNRLQNATNWTWRSSLNRRPVGGIVVGVSVDYGVVVGAAVGAVVGADVGVVGADVGVGINVGLDGFDWLGGFPGFRVGSGEISPNAGQQSCSIGSFPKTLRFLRLIKQQLWHQQVINHIRGNNYDINSIHMDNCLL